MLKFPKDATQTDRHFAWFGLGVLLFVAIYASVQHVFPNLPGWEWFFVRRAIGFAVLILTAVVAWAVLRN